MRHQRPIVHLALLLAALSCAAGTDPVTPAAPPQDAAAEQSVRPGANDRFLSADLDVARFVEVFEGESREIFVERKALTDALRLAPGMQVADIGAGTGLFVPLFAAAVGESGGVHAVDISPKFVEHLRERAAEAGLANVEVVLGGDRATGLAPASVDAAFVCDTYHHFEYPESMLADLRAAIRPGGTLLIVDFERIPGVTEQWIVDHVRAGKDVFRSEIEAAGFVLVEEVDVPGLRENYVLRFRRQ